MIRRIALGLTATLLSSSCAMIGLSSPCGGTEIIGKFDQVGDLVKNSNVQSSDVTIGTVTDIELDRGNWQATVTMCLDEGEQIPADVQAVVRTTSLLGEKFIDLKPQGSGPPFLEEGDVIDADQTSKATELEDVFAKLAAVLGTGNLEQINRFTSAQATILRDRAGDVRQVLNRLRRFTDVLADRKDQIAASIDSLDSVARTAVDDSQVLEEFLTTFADSSGVLADQKDALQDLLFALDRFTGISVQLLRETEAGLDSQFRDLRPVLRTAVANSRNLTEALRTLATFSRWFPETMPGDYLQLDVCQAQPDSFGQGTTCPQSVANDDPDASGSVSNGLELILEQPLRGAE